MLTLSADRERYFRGERVRLTLTVKNIGDHEIPGHFELDPMLQSAHVEYRAPGTRFQELRTFPAPAGSFGLRRRILGVGEEHVAHVEVAVAALKPPAFLLDQAGVYEFRVLYEDIPEDSNSVLESNVIAMEVVDAPAEEQDAQEAYSPTIAYVAQIARGSRAFVPAERMIAAAAFIERFPRSRYAGPVKEGLLKHLQYRVRTQRASAEERALLEKLARTQDTTPPDLHVEAAPATLWPANHKLVEVHITVNVIDGEDPSPVAKLVSITCDDGCAAGQDIAGTELGTDDREFELRAERRGAGAGRTYTITYSASDASGNEARAVTAVVVPHDQGEKK